MAFALGTTCLSFLFMSQAMLARAETKVKEMRQTVDILRNESKKLEVMSFPEVHISVHQMS